VASRLGTGKPLTFFAVYSNDISPYVPFYKKFFSYFLWLECIGYSVVYVAHFVFLGDFWIQTHRELSQQAGALPPTVSP
jgi:hypothetical protein